jgi:hypothetical protein
MSQIYIGDSGMSSITKKCTRCGETKSLDDFYKPNPKTGKQESRCKACMRERAKEWGDKNPERKQTRLEKWRAENRDHELEYKRRYHKEHRDEELPKKRAYHKANVEREREYKNRHRRENYEKHRESFLKWFNANVEKIREAGRRWNEANRERRSQYYKDNRERYNQHSHTRRARIKGNGGIYTVSEWLALKEHYNHTCLCCGRREPEIVIEPDHILPITKGGSNSIDNIQPLCVSCNRRKSTKHIDYRKG